MQPNNWVVPITAQPGTLQGAAAQGERVLGDGRGEESAEKWANKGCHGILGPGDN